MSRLRFVLALVGLIAAGPATAAGIGVTAAVNPSAHGAPPGGGIRVLTLGEDVIRDERITTDSAGLVQVLFADGTTLTLGPRSDLVIDRYIYDPDKNTAELAATMSKGVLRFIGGLASKGENPATITVPTGTIGIRGAITDISLDTSAGTPPHIDMLFGRDVTLTSGGDVLGRIYQGGYSLVLGPGGVTVVKTPPEWASQIQTALSGGPGTNGGAPRQPSNQTVASSGVPQTNSDNAVSQNAPPQPMPRPDRPDDVIDTSVADVGHDVIPEGGSGTPHHAAGAATMVGSYTDTYEDENYTGVIPLTAAYDANGEPRPSTVSVDETGRPVAADLYLQIPGCTDCVLEVQEGSGGAGTMTVHNAYGSGQMVTIPVLASFASHQDIALPQGTQYCTCAFLDWGTWNMSGSYSDPYYGQLDFAVQNGTWLAGDMTSASQLSDLASTTATYTGHAIGEAFDSQGTHLASGDMSMQWSFGAKNGTMSISNFDGHNFQGVVGAMGSQSFEGGLAGGNNGVGYVNGNFYNDGANTAAGVGGSMFLYEDQWGATGIFMGER